MLVEQYLKKIQGVGGPKVSVQTNKQIVHDDPGAYRFQPPGTKHPVKGIIKGQQSKFKRQTPDIKEDAGAQLAMAGGVAAGVIATSLVAWAHKKYMEIYGKANESCGKMKGSEGRLCRQNYKVQAAKAEIQALKFARSKCRRAKDPKVCVQTLNKKIRDLTSKNPDIEYTMKAIAKHKKD